MQKITKAELEVRAQAIYDNSFNHTKHCHIDICDDFIAGTLLSKILYWFGYAEDGKQRVRVEHRGYVWLAKSREDWYDELRISPKQVDRGLKKLKDLGYITKITRKFAGSPTTHVRPHFEILEKKIDAWKQKIKDELEAKILKNYPGKLEIENHNIVVPELESENSNTQKPSIRRLLPKGKKPANTGYYPKGNFHITQRAISSIHRLHTLITSSVVVLTAEKKSESASDCVIKDCKEKAKLMFGDAATKLSTNFWREFIILAKKNNKDVTTIMENVHNHFTKRGKTIDKLQGALKYEVEQGWEEKVEINPVKQVQIKPYNWLNDGNISAEDLRKHKEEKAKLHKKDMEKGVTKAR